MYALVDVNNMYVSCERVFRPALNGRPVVVLSNNDGNCIARSNEAKDLGVKMAQPWFQVRHLQKQAGLVALSANFELYGDMSSRMMTLAAAHAPRQQVYSIDECFLDFEGLQADLVAIGRRLRAQVLQWTGLPTSVGFGPTKTLAKLANHVAKMADRGRGGYPAALAQVCHLGPMSAAERSALFAATEVGDVWGVGPRMTARLTEGGVRTVQDLLHADLPSLRRQFSVMIEKTVTELRGTPCIGVDDEPAAPQQIMCSRSFADPLDDAAALAEVLSQFTTRVAEKLRQQQAEAGAVHVFFATSPFRRNDRQHSASLTLPLARPTADTRLLIATALHGLGQMFRPGFNYLKAGVMLVDLRPQGRHQQAELDLFGTSPPPSQPLMDTLDRMNRRFGRGALAIASAAHQGGGAAPASRQQRRSPRYSTRLDEVVSVRC